VLEPASAKEEDDSNEDEANLIAKGQSYIL
jgi:hypothetical protein